MLQFSDHMIALYEMWLQKEGSKVHEPAEYYHRLLASIPSENEGPLARGVVHAWVGQILLNCNVFKR